MLVTSPHKTDIDGREAEEEMEEDDQEEEEEEERDSGTESVKETVLWEEKVTFANIPCNNQHVVSEL